MTSRQDADAFDDLLGQLVDELAMTPTMPAEPEIAPHMAVPGGTTIGPVPDAPSAAGSATGAAVGPETYYPEPKKSSSLGLGLGIGGGLAILGLGLGAMVIFGKEDPPVVQPAAAVEQKADAKAAEPPASDARRNTGARYRCAGRWRTRSARCCRPRRSSCCRCPRRRCRSTRRCRTYHPSRSEARRKKKRRRRRKRRRAGSSGGKKKKSGGGKTLNPFG